MIFRMDLCPDGLSLLPDRSEPKRSDTERFIAGASRWCEIKQGGDGARASATELRSNSSHRGQGTGNRCDRSSARGRERCSKPEQLTISELAAPFEITMP